MKKIAVIGTHGTGKTTIGFELCAGLKRFGGNADFLSEVARSCVLPLNEGTTEAAQRWILHTQIARELEKEGQGFEYLVCERGTVDNYAYFVRAFGNDAVLENLAMEHMKTYSHIFKIPINYLEDGLKEDGIRAMDPVFQKDIDSLIDKLLDSYKIPFYNFENIPKALEIILNE